MEIWINPACSKCRAALERLDAAKAEYKVRRYLEQPPTVAELDDALVRLGLEPWELARPGDGDEAIANLPREQGRRADWLAAMVANPRLIQRPVLLLDDGTAVVGRTPEAVDRAIASQQARA